MRYTLYSERPVAECVKALNERIAQPGAASRPKMDGKAEKSGAFTLGMKAPVALGFRRQTWIEGQIVREGGQTTIYGSAPDGLNPQRQRQLLIATPLVAAFLTLTGAPVPAVVVAGLMVFLWLILRGDYFNSDRLLLELERQCRASPKPPKKPNGKK
ncbi:MAG: hypothetical protein H3C32_05780 [Anaerolineae bacterium]|nr:hypothetical protein [Anaerolineae bacterium]